jgi:putative peroxiredoxin
MLHLRNGISQSLNFSIITDFFKKIICRLRGRRNKQAI